MTSPSKTRLPKLIALRLPRYYACLTNEAVSLTQLRPTLRSGSKPLIDVDALVTTTLSDAENAKGLREWREKRRGRKEEMADERRRFERELEEFDRRSDVM